jgi:hypothetical protein
MAVAVKPIEQSAERWERRASQAAEDYVRGTDQPKRPWAESTLAAEANYKAAVTAAANAGRQGAGVRKAGNQKWKSAIDRKGRANFTTGVIGAGQDWAAGSRPYQQAVATVTLPPRGPKNSPANYQRVQLIGDTQSKLRQAMLSGTR